MNLFKSTTGTMGTTIIRPSDTERAVIILPDRINKNKPPDPPLQLTVVTTSSSNKIKIAKRPRFTGDKKNWEGFILAVDNYLMAYHNKFKDDKQKI